MKMNDPQDKAIADLAVRLDIEPDAIEVVAHDEVTWRDGSIGCPKPGLAYTQALVDGYRIILRAEGREFAYHGRGAESPFFCDRPDPNGAIEG